MELPIIELSGSPRAMGERYGEQVRERARELYEIRLNWAMRHAAERHRTFSSEQVLAVAECCLKPTQGYDPVGYEEFLGIARGTGLTPAQCFVLQGLTDLQDVLSFAPQAELEGCSSFVVAKDRSATGYLLCGQNWDLKTDNMPFVILVHRKPDDAPETWALTTTGCLTLIGVNSAGVAVGNTNLKATDSRIGVQYLSVLHRALRARSRAEAAQAVREAPRAGAHYYYVADATGAVCLECTAKTAAEVDVRESWYVHCNHFLDEKAKELEAESPLPSTCHRQNRLSFLLRHHEGAIGIEDLKGYLSDHDGGPEVCICRHGDSNNASTNACLILSPQTCEIHACRGQPHVGQWVTRRAGTP